MISYHDDYSAISKSMLSVFIKSPVEYYHKFISGLMPWKEPTNGMELGTAVHAVLLEDKRLEDLYLAYPDSCLNVAGGINPKPAAKFREDNPDKFFCKADEYQQHVALVNAVKYHKPLMDGIASATHKEQSFYWTDDDSGLVCRCKPDIVFDLGGQTVIYDLKVSPQISDDDFARTARRFHYWLQDAHYSEGMEVTLGKPVDFAFVVIEPVFPFRVHIKRYDPRSREIAKDNRSRELRKLVNAMANKTWVDNWSGELVLSSWDVPDEIEWEVEDGEVQF